MERHRVALHASHPGPLAREAARRLAEVLGDDASMGDFDEVGIIEIELPAGSREEALQRAFDAMALAGADDELIFAEHPDIPGHWRRRTEERRAERIAARGP
jgi:hypothetical protein